MLKCESEGALLPVRSLQGAGMVRGGVCCADRDGTVLDNPPLPEEICADPLLGALKLIAWSGNDALLPRSGARGFPHWGVWLQRNTRFSADLAPFVAGLPATAGGVATRCPRSRQCLRVSMCDMPI